MFSCGLATPQFLSKNIDWFSKFSPLVLLINPLITIVPVEEHSIHNQISEGKYVFFNYLLFYLFIQKFKKSHEAEKSIYITDSSLLLFDRVWQFLLPVTVRCSMQNARISCLRCTWKLEKQVVSWSLATFMTIDINYLQKHLLVIL